MRFSTRERGRRVRRQKSARDVNGAERASTMRSAPCSPSPLTSLRPMRNHRALGFSASYCTPLRLMSTGSTAMPWRLASLTSTAGE